MPTTVITNVDTGGVALRSEEFSDETLTFAGADTFVAGTILGRVTATGKLLPLATGASDGSQNARAVLTYDVTRANAGDMRVRVLVRGVVNRNRLLLDADGNGTNITAALLDQLRDYGITPVEVQQLARVDNPQT